MADWLIAATIGMIIGGWGTTVCALAIVGVAIGVMTAPIRGNMRERIEMMGAGVGVAVVFVGFAALCVWGLYDDVQWVIGIVRWLSPWK